MNQFVENLTGMDKLNDQIIASDLLISAKTGVKSIAAAIVEASTPQVRSVLKRQLDDAINFHQKVSDYMIDKGWYKAYDIDQQIQMDINFAKDAMNLQT